MKFGTIESPLVTIGTLTITTKATIAILDVSSTASSLSVGTIVLTNIYSTGADWADYSATSTIVGWSSFTTKAIYTKRVGKLMFVAFRLEGTSNSATTTFTVPNTSANTTVWFGGAMLYAKNNGVALTGATRCTLPDNSNVVTLGKDMAGAVWTDSGNKIGYGMLWFEIA